MHILGSIWALFPFHTNLFTLFWFGGVWDLGWFGLAVFDVAGFGLAVFGLLVGVGWRCSGSFRVWVGGVWCLRWFWDDCVWFLIRYVGTLTVQLWFYFAGFSYYSRTTAYGRVRRAP